MLASTALRIRRAPRCAVLVALSCSVSASAWAHPVAAPRPSDLPADLQGSWNLVPADPAPADRTQPATAYDSARRRMWIFGGTLTSGGVDSTTWYLPLGDTLVWHAVTTPSNPPARTGASAVWDPAGDRLLLYGGMDAAGTALGDLWQLTLGDSPAWQQLFPAGPTPPARTLANTILDPIRHRLIVFSGQATGWSFLSDTWALSLGDTLAWNDWGASTAFGPRVGGAAIYDPLRDRMLVCGGFDGSFCDGDLHALNLGAPNGWSTVTIAGTYPRNRYDAAFAYDPVHDQLLVLEGTPGASPSQVCLSDAWGLSLAGTPTWTQYTSWARSAYGSRAVWDDAAQRLVRYGGVCDSRVSTWDPVAGERFVFPVPPLSDGGAVYDAHNDRYILFAGAGSADNRVWAVNPETFQWTPIIASGTPPVPRRGAGVVYDDARGRLLVVSGVSGAGFVLDDLWVLPLDGAPAWSYLTMTNTPPARYHASVAVDAAHDRLVLYGGTLGAFKLTSANDTWVMPFATQAWSRAVPANAPAPPRRAGADTWLDPAQNRLWISGGVRDSCWQIGGGGCAAQYYGDTWSLDLQGTTGWRAESVGAPGTPHAFASYAFDAQNARFLQLGGEIGYLDLVSDSVFALTPGDAVPAWTALTPSGSGPRTSMDPAIYDPVRSRVVLFRHGAREEIWTLTFAPAVVGVPGGADGSQMRSVVTVGGRRLALRVDGPRPFRIRDAQVRDVAGRRIAALSHTAGAQSRTVVEWNGRREDGHPAPRGIYLLDVDTDAGRIVRRAVYAPATR